jgi:hypothetical protein
MTDERQPRQSKDVEHPPTPEPDNETLRDLSLREEESAVKGGPGGNPWNQ